MIRSPVPPTQCGQSAACLTFLPCAMTSAGLGRALAIKGGISQARGSPKTDASFQVGARYGTSLLAAEGR